MSKSAQVRWEERMLAEIEAVCSAELAANQHRNSRSSVHLSSTEMQWALQRFRDGATREEIAAEVVRHQQEARAAARAELASRAIVPIPGLTA